MTMTLSLIALALTLSLSSLTVVILRVSPLTAPQYAIPFLILSVFIAVTSFLTLVLFFAKKLLSRGSEKESEKQRPHVLARKLINTSLRQGIFFAFATCVVIFLWLMGIVNWWIAVLIYMVFVLVEMAIGR